MSNPRKEECLACGEKLRTASLLVCSECLGEGCELFLTASEIDQPDEILEVKLHPQDIQIIPKEDIE
jgi:hypothetical protein